MDDEALLAESGELSRMLIEIADRARDDFAAAAGPLGVPVPLARAVLLLEQPIAMRALAAELAYDPSYVTGLADQLEERGLGRRTVGSDRRVKLLELTSEGRAVRERLAANVARRAAVAYRLSPDRRALLGELLREVLALQTAADG